MLICLSAAIAGVPCCGQEGAGNREIETDRDSFTPALTTVERKRFMVESAWSYIDNKELADTHSFPELLLRYGWSDWLEVRFGANYEVGGESSGVSSGATLSETASASGLSEESNLSYGLKAQLTTQHGWLPQSAMTVTGSSPTTFIIWCSAARLPGKALGFRIDNGLLCLLDAGGCDIFAAFPATSTCHFYMPLLHATQACSPRRSLQDFKSGEFFR